MPSENKPCSERCNHNRWNSNKTQRLIIDYNWTNKSTKKEWEFLTEKRFFMFKSSKVNDSKYDWGREKTIQIIIWPDDFYATYYNKYNEASLSKKEIKIKEGYYWPFWNYFCTFNGKRNFGDNDRTKKLLKN